MIAEVRSIQLNDVDVPTATITAETEVSMCQQPRLQPRLKSASDLAFAQR
jgi:hypothetical protein